MTIFDQFWRENSNISNFSPRKVIILTTFQTVEEFVVFGQKMDL